MAFGALEEILEQCSREGEPFWSCLLYTSDAADE